MLKLTLKQLLKTVILILPFFCILPINLTLVKTNQINQSNNIYPFPALMMLLQNL